MAALTEEGEFFTLQSLRKQGFSDELDDDDNVVGGNAERYRKRQARKKAV